MTLRKTAGVVSVDCKRFRGNSSFLIPAGFRPYKENTVTVTDGVIGADITITANGEVLGLERIRAASSGSIIYMT